ncbi:PREDICTED: pro-corazonin-like isoform X2 [Dinoponera quadriceps]|uniref:Pro-corazonin n=1 Tax=Dinoponera quadriceps TaxID=609295 RepID=A0A6P3WWV8_DINQU|nr:PREDICTED: pro-corazonin-like isoform X2 [Dinoponera quadriceps]
MKTSARDDDDERSVPHEGLYKASRRLTNRVTSSVEPYTETHSEQRERKSRCVKMANYRCILAFLILLLVMNAVFCQTFQYSRGWTNGKRSEFPNSAEVSNSISDEGFTSNELKKLKMLMHGNVDEQPLLIHCDFMDKLRKLFHSDNYAPQLHREKGQNDDNY